MQNLVSRRRFLQGISGAAAAALVPAAVSIPAMAVPSNGAIEATRQALAGNFSAAGPMAQQSGDQAAIKLVELLYLRDHGPEAGYPRIIAFLEAAPGWPLFDTLMKRAEIALYENHEPANVVSAHFAGRKPATPQGALALARMAYAAGDQPQGKLFLRQAWGDSDVDSALEDKILSEFGSRLSADDHRMRLWQLIYGQQGNAAVRHARRVGGDYVNAAKAAQALINGNSGGEAAYRALPSSLRNELALQYVLTRYYRRTERFDKARAILASVPGDPTAMGNAEAWFEERRTAVRRSVGPLQHPNWKTAYIIAKNHGLQSGDFAIDAEFLAGWVALRYLGNPQMALTHFLKLQKLADTGTERARAAYWIGRAQKALGNVAPARASFQSASKHSTVYYGQLAREEIGLGKMPEEISPAGSSDGAKARVEQDEVVRALRLMSRAGGKAKLGIFMSSLSKRFGSDDELNAVASVMQQEGGTPTSLRFAKSASQQGHDLDTWAYPITGLPTWAQIGKPVEKSLVFALSRQESEFDPNAGSSVGAQGLMQLMPGTARLIAKQYNIGFSAGKLRDADYNVKLGAAHLADLVDDLNGSYVLTLVAYNAGPKRARDWLSYFGDPRGAQVDPVDWVECIPFNETRQYVQKVMQNLHVYRSRLAPDTVRPMSVDLRRGTPDDMSVASTAAVSPAGDCKPTSVKSLIASCN